MMLGLVAASTAQASVRAVAHVKVKPSDPLPKVLRASLGPGWWTSRDVMLESSEDSSGYHLFLAKGSLAYAWQPLATLRPGGLDVAAWSGYSCLTGDGRYAVAVVAPSYYANNQMLRDRGAFAYVVDVRSGTVRPVVAGVALKYYSPGCGSGDVVTLTRNLGEDQGRTELISVNAVTATISHSVTLAAR